MGVGGGMCVCGNSVCGVVVVREGGRVMCREQPAQGPSASRQRAVERAWQGVWDACLWGQQMGSGWRRSLLSSLGSALLGF